MINDTLFLKLRYSEGIDRVATLASADTASVDADGNNLLHEIAVSGNSTEALLLIEKAVSVNQQNGDGQCPLHFAASRKNTPVLLTLLQHSADPNIVDHHGNTPLWTAVFNAHGHYESVRLLIEFGADPDHVNKYGRSPRSFAEQIKDSSLLGLMHKT